MTTLRESHSELLAALKDVMSYAKAFISLPRESWPSDSVILKADTAISRAEAIRDEPPTDAELLKRIRILEIAIENLLSHQAGP